MYICHRTKKGSQKQNKKNTSAVHYCFLVAQIYRFAVSYTMLISRLTRLDIYNTRRHINIVVTLYSVYIGHPYLFTKNLFSSRRLRIIVNIYRFVVVSA